MKKTLQELNSLARIISNIFDGYSPLELFSNHLDLKTPIYRNYNRDGVGFPKDIKKPFGYKSVLESFARSLKFNTYNGLVESGKTEFDLDAFALMPMNPFPLNRFYTNMWEALSVAILSDLLEDTGFSEQIALGFKHDSRNDEALKDGYGLTPLIKPNTFSDDGWNITDLRFSARYKGYHHFYGVATSMFSYALANSGHNEDELSVISDLKLRDFVAFKEWDDSNFTVFKKHLIQMMNRLYKVDLAITGRQKNPLDREVVIRHKEGTIISRGDTKDADIEPDIFKEIMLNNQIALKKIADEIIRDKQYYRLDPTQEYIIYATDERCELGSGVRWGRDTKELYYHEFREKVVDAESFSELSEQPRKGEELAGTKIYLLNLMRYEHPLGHDKYNTVPTVDEIIEYWKTRVLNNLIPCKKREAMGM